MPKKDILEILDKIIKRDIRSLAMEIYRLSLNMEYYIEKLTSNKERHKLQKVYNKWRKIAHTNNEDKFLELSIKLHKVVLDFSHTDK